MPTCPSRKTTRLERNPIVLGLGESKVRKISYQPTTGAAGLGIANGKI
tara:strand:+ start:3138 stop:3281 length:144 start_codon:yes stop_codon:yes gene_type:complete